MTAAQLETVPGLKSWQRQDLGDELLASLRRPV
jgi:hypothetical protein